MRSFSIIILFSVILFAGIISADWPADLELLLTVQDADGQDELIRKIKKTRPGYQDIIEAIQNIGFTEPESTGLQMRENICVDNITRPWILYIPPDYDPDQAASVFVNLHGGVSRAEIYDDPIGYFNQHLLTKLGTERGYIMICPFGQDGATWWDDVGMANISSLIRQVKSEFNIDDNRVYLGGFSDGASAAFLQAMVSPDDFAALIALNGHMGVGSEDGDLPTYATNFFNSTIYATAAYNDNLYPSSKMRPTIDLALEAGGNLLYREFAGGHDLEDLIFMLPSVFDFMAANPRNPFPVSIIWESATKKFGRCRYLSIDKTGKNEPEEWHKDYNIALTDDRISIGFVPADYEGEGVEIGTVVDGDNLANRIGLAPGDVIISAGKLKISNLDDLSDFKSRLSRGDEVELAIIRDGETLTLKGSLPDIKNHLLFKRSVPSGAIKATYSANRFYITTSNVTEFTVYLHPEMINYNQNVVIFVNGVKVFDSLPRIDIEFLLRNFLKNRDRVMLYTDKITLNLNQDEFAKFE